MVARYSYILVFVLQCNKYLQCETFNLISQSIQNLNSLPSSNRFHRIQNNVSKRKSAIFSISPKSSPSWEELSGFLPSEEIIQNMATKSIDSALDPTKPNYSTSHPTLFRERHGWCPYSERAWLTVEYKNIPYDTIRIDNTGPGAKPSYYSGQTPQIRWEDGRTQGESMDIVYDLDQKSYPSPSLETGVLYDDPNVEEKIKAWKQIFPRGARPSSRAAYLFSWNGDPLPKSEFQRVLSETDDLLQSTRGPFFCGSSFTAADIAWIPFLERYAAQLPCLHSDLNPRDENMYPHLYRWYEAIQNQIPAYSCRVKGDASSWRKVLGMAGYGNMGNVPFDIKGRMTKESNEEMESFLSPDNHTREMKLWMEYRSTRDYLAESPSAEAAAVVLRNRDAIVKDIEKRIKFTKEWKDKLPLQKENGLDNAMRILVYLLVHEGKSKDEILAIQDDIDSSLLKDVGMLATFLDERMCVPRDMGEMSAAAIKRIATRLSQ